MNIDVQVIVGIGNNFNAGSCIPEFNFFRDGIENPVGLLFNDTGRKYRINKGFGTVGDDGGLGSVDLHEGIVDPQAVECSQQMFNRSYGSVLVYNSGASFGNLNIFGKSPDYRISCNIRTFKLIPVIFRGRTNGNLNFNT